MLALSLVSTVLSLYIPYLSRLLIDRALLGGDSHVLVRILLQFAALTLGSFALNVVSGLVYTRTSADILFEMRLGLFRQLQRLSPRFYAEMPIGQIATRLNADIGEIQRVAAEIALAWVGNVLFLVGSIVILFRLDLVLFGVSFAILPAALWALVRYRSQLEAAVTGVRDRSADVGSFLIETLLGMKVIVGFNAQEREADRFRERNDAFIRALMSMRRLTYLSGGVPGLLLSAGSGAVFLVGGMRVIDHSITMGTLVAFIAYQMRLVWPIQALMGLYASLASARVSLRRVNEILDAPLDVVEVDGRGGDTISARKRHARRGDVHVRAWRRGARRRVGRDSGRPTLGDRGPQRRRANRRSPTSSFASSIPRAGACLLDGVDLRTAKLEDVRRNILVVDQEPFVFNATIAENIRYARPGASDADVRAAADAAGLTPLLARLPQRDRQQRR